jgi:hypothetical protein
LVNTLGSTIERQNMRFNLVCRATIMVPLLALSQAGPADAAPRKKIRPTSEINMTANPLAANGYTGYYERVLNRVPYGSQLWWRVYHSYPRN